MIKLEDYIKEINEKAEKDNQYRILTSSQNGIVAQEEYFNKKVASKDTTGYKIIRKGQFTYRAMSDTGRFYINLLKQYDVGIVSPAYPVFELLENKKLMPEYLQNFFKSDKFQAIIAFQSRGSTRVSLKLDKIKAITLSVPTYDRQVHIVLVIQKVSELIALRKKQLEKLDELVKSRFVEMFGDLKLNPMNWSITPFSVFAVIDCNMTKEYKKYADFPHIGIDSIEKETGNLIGYRTIKEDGVISGKYLFTPEHIIYSKIRPNLNKVALPNFFGLCSADAYPILPNKKNCNRIFLATVMRSPYFLDYILQFCNRTNLPKVNKKEISGFKMPLPPLLLQNDFSNFVTKVDKQKLTIQQSLDKLEVLKKALMQQYFG